MPALSRVRGAYNAHRRGFTRAMYIALLSSFGIRVYLSMRAQPESSPRSEKAGPKRGVSVDIVFLRNLRRLLKIAIPRWASTETLLVCLQAVFLIIRTMLSLYVARLDGRITAYLIRGQGRKFLQAVAWWFVIGLPASVTNAVLQYLQRLIALRVRSNLTRYTVDEYLEEERRHPMYYAIQRGGVSGMDVGQVVSADTAKFSSALSRLFSNLAKPVLDVTVYTWQLSRSIGADNVFFLGIAIQLSARALRLAAPPFGEFVATEAALEGDFRTKHSRLIQYSEEVALYDAHKPEKSILDRSFYSLTTHIDHVFRHRLAYNVSEDFVVKYFWGALGLVLCSIPVFSGSSASSRAQNFVVNRRLLLLSSDAVGRIMSSYKDINSLAGYTFRLTQFLDEMDTIHHESEIEQKTEGVFEDGDYVEFSHVPVISPTGEVLIKDLTFKISPGNHLLIVGPNGSGKSSLFRVLGGLWPLRSGKVVRPPKTDVFYIPQRPYLSRGSLRQQIIYPESESETKATDGELLAILEILGLRDLVDHVGGLQAVREWRDDLSMGSQQKIAAARLFYHKPKFAILDECTASVTLDAETTIYTHAQELGITLLTVSHRASLWRYHNKILQLDGQGGYLFADLNPAQRLALEEEKLKIEQKLRHVESMKERLATLEAEKSKRGSVPRIQELAETAA